MASMASVPVEQPQVKPSFAKVSSREAPRSFSLDLRLISLIYLLGRCICLHTPKYERNRF